MSRTAVAHDVDVREGAGHMDTLNAPSGSGPDTVTVAAPLFVHETMVSRLAAWARGPMRCLALPPALVRAYACDGVFNAAITVGTDELVPEAWSRVHVGDVGYGLFGSPALARTLGPAPTFDDVLAVPFVGAVFISRDGVLTQGHDRCPVPRSERRIGHEAESVGLACRIAAETEHLVYGPTAAAAPFVVDGALIEVRVPGWSQSDPLFLSCNSASLSAAAQDSLATLIRFSFETVRHESGVVELAGAPPEAHRRRASR